MDEWKIMAYQGVPSKPNPKGGSFHLLTVSIWEGDVGVVIAEIETWAYTGALFGVWFGHTFSVDFLYLSYIKKRFLDGVK